jgi:uncharacterized protein with GYD domain
MQVGLLKQLPLGSYLRGGRQMPQYIMLVNFTDQGLKGVKDVPNRQDKSRETAKQFGVERKTVWSVRTL